MLLYIQGRDINYFLICKEGFTDSLIFQTKGSLPEAQDGGKGRSKSECRSFNAENDQAAFIINGLSMAAIKTK